MGDQVVRHVVSVSRRRERCSDARTDDEQAQRADEPRHGEHRTFREQRPRWVHLQRPTSSIANQRRRVGKQAGALAADQGSESPRPARHEPLGQRAAILSKYR